jgi:hypothetical protein
MRAISGEALGKCLPIANSGSCYNDYSGLVTTGHRENKYTLINTCHCEEASIALAIEPTWQSPRVFRALVNDDLRGLLQQISRYARNDGFSAELT